MAKITCKGWRDEPEEDWHQAYDVLTGRKKPFYVVFGRQKTSSKHPEKDLENQTKHLENESER